MRIGIMGGTFDPIHIGHLIIGEAAWQQYALDKVLYMPSGNPPHKTHREGRATDEERLEMVRLAIADNPHFELSDREMHADGYTYTYRTLEALKALHPDDTYYFIIGADSLKDFPTWMKPQRICDACVLLVAERNHITTEKLDLHIRRIRELFGASVEKLMTENVDIASSELRKWIRDGSTIRYYVPDSVRRYILEHNLYRT